MNRPAEALAEMLAAFDRLEIAYMVGGSVASSIHGLSRPTQDVDIVAKLTRQQLAAFFELLRKDFYGDLDTAGDAIERGRALKLIHFASSYKFDNFPLKSAPFDQQEFARRTGQANSVWTICFRHCGPTAAPDGRLHRKPRVASVYP